MIHRDRLWQATGLGETFEHRLHARARDRCVDLDRHALARAVIDDVQASQASSIRQAITYKVHRPADVGRCWLGQRLAFDEANAFTLAPTHQKACLAIQPIDALAVHRPAFTAKPHVDASIAVTPLLLCDLSDALTQL